MDQLNNEQCPHCTLLAKLYTLTTGEQWKYETLFFSNIGLCFRNKKSCILVEVANGGSALILPFENVIELFNARSELIERGIEFHLAMQRD